MEIPARFSPAMCDYLRITFRESEDFAPLVDLVSFGFQLCSVGHGFDGFTSGYLDAANGLKYATGGEQQRGRGEFVLPGNACKQLYAKGLFDSFLLYCSELPGVRCTRFDLCKDDFTGEVFDWWVSLPDSVQAVRLHSFNWCLRKWNRDLDRDHKPKPGYTYYSGGPDSSCMVRLYDKSIERGVSDKIPHWVRLEFETRSKCGKKPLADSIFHSITDGSSDIDHCYKSVAEQFFRLLVENDRPTNDHNRGRIKTDPVFQSFIDDFDMSAQKTSFALLQLDIDRGVKRDIYVKMVEALIPLIASQGFSSRDLVPWFRELLIKYPLHKLRPYGIDHLEIIDISPGEFYVSGITLDGIVLGPDGQICADNDKSNVKEVSEGAVQIEVL